MNVVGLDLSISATGIAWADDRVETITTSPRDGAIEARIETIVDRVMGANAWTPYNADVVAIEDVPYGAHGTVPLAMLHGVLRVHLHREGVPFVLIPPASLKKYATGRGNAKKPDLRMALYKRTGLDLADDNQVDAWWLRAMALDRYGHPALDMPATHRDALAKIEWPAPTGGDL